MDDQEYFSVIQEQDPDFSARICKGLKLEDLSDEAIQNMRQMIYKKRNRTDVLTVPLQQLLKDLELLSEEGLNFAALILLGKSNVIKQHLPQNNVVVEYRLSDNQIRYSARQEFREPLFTGIEKIWKYINQDAINPLIHLDAFPQIQNIKSFTEETIREAILNSIQHRSFQMGGDILIKVSPQSFEITNSGGFPYGVNLNNLLTVNSSPRSRRLAEVIEKAGLIEKSGQGVDIMFANCISEGRTLPDYNASDDFQVKLRIETKIQNSHLRNYIYQIQKDRESKDRLNIFDLLTLYSISIKQDTHIYQRSINRLISERIIILHPKYGYEMGDNYFMDFQAVISGKTNAETMRRLFYILESGPKQMSAFLSEWEKELSVKQIRNMIENLIGTVLMKRGRGKGTTYEFVNKS